MKKWVVTIHDLDGINQKNHTEKDRAISYMSKQTGIEIKREEVARQIVHNGYFSIQDKWGRTVEIVHIEVGYCKVCKKSNKPLYGIRVFKPKKEHKVSVCLECLDAYECGVWTIEEEQGKEKVVRLEY